MSIFQQDHTLLGELLYHPTIQTHWNQKAVEYHELVKSNDNGSLKGKEMQQQEEEEGGAVGDRLKSKVS